VRFSNPVGRGRRWVRSHVRVAVGAASEYTCVVSEWPPPTFAVVRIQPCFDWGTHVLQEVER
jgi:hypothetical protein